MSPFPSQTWNPEREISGVCLLFQTSLIRSPGERTLSSPFCSAGLFLQPGQFAIVAVNPPYLFIPQRLTWGFAHSLQELFCPAGWIGYVYSVLLIHATLVPGVSQGRPRTGQLGDSKREDDLTSALFCFQARLPDFLCCHCLGAGYKIGPCKNYYYYYCCGNTFYYKLVK